MLLLLELKQTPMLLSSPVRDLIELLGGGVNTLNFQAWG